VVGTAIALSHGAVHWASALCALLGAVLIQVGANYANDYSDFVKGADTAERVGPTRATQAGLVSPAAMRNAAVLTFALAFLPGAYIVHRGGWPFVVIGVLAILCGVLYTAGPYPLGYVGVADLFVLIFFGPVAVCGTYYLQAHRLPADVIISALGPGLLSVALLTVNNLRDVDEDRRAAKKTLAVRFGRTFARAEYVACLLVAALAVPVYLLLSTGRLLFLLVPLVVLVVAAPTIVTVLTATGGPALNRALAATGRLLLIFSAVFSLAWLLDYWRT